MTNYKLFEKFIRAPYEFSISKQIVKEKTGKAIGFMMFGYLLFVILLGAYLNLTFVPELEELIDDIKVAIEEMPEFTIEDGQFTAEGGIEYKVYSDDDLHMIIDTNDQYDLDYYNNEYETYYAFRSDRLIVNGGEVVRYNILQETMNNDTVKAIPDVFKSLFYLGYVILALLGILGIFFLSAVLWGLVIIINGFLRVEISSGDCYKLVPYTMLVPAVLTLLTLLLPFEVPGFIMIYLAVAAFYAYKYLSHYEHVEIDVKSLLED